MGRTKKGKKATKPKAKVKKELQIVPRLRLEPRLSPKLSKKTPDKPVAEDNSELLKIHGQDETRPLTASLLCNPSKEMRSDYEQEHEAPNLVNNNNAVNVASSSSEPFSDPKDYEQEHETSTLDTQMSVDDVVQEEEKEERKPQLRKSYDWNDRELLDLAIGLETEGTADLKKVAAYVKTKNENDISVYLKKRCLDERKSENYFGRLSRWSSISAETMSMWPNIRKWRKLAHEQMLPLIRCKDYSKPVILALCKKFFEEEAEPADPQVINVKMIYKYLMDCMSGEIPAQLPPKESALVLDLLREVRLMPLAYDFEEELKFLKGFKEATKFRPFEVKDEFKKRFKKSHNDESLGPNTVSVPEEVFMDLSRHKKLIQSFNPLVSPVWMLQKEQEVLEKHVEESAVYVD